MRWSRLVLERAPNVAPGLSLEDCAPGLNIVFGPNGVGKTTFSQAARALLWREQSLNGGRAVGALHLGASTFVVERDGSAPPMWEPSPTSSLPLPDERFRACFHLSLEELVSASATDDAIATEIRKEMGGGYELDAVASEVVKQAAGKTGRAAKALKAALTEVTKVEQAARDALAREETLPALERQLEEAEKKVRNREVLAALLMAAEETVRLDGLREAGKGADPLLRRFENETQHERLVLLHGELEKARVTERDRERKLSDAEKDLAGLGLQDGGANAQALADGKSAAKALENALGKRDALAEAIADLEGQLQGALTTEWTGEWSDSELESARSLIGERDQRRQEREAWTKALTRLPDSETTNTERGVVALLDWLAAGSDRGAPAGRSRALLLAAAALVAAFAAAPTAGVDVPTLAWVLPFALIVFTALRTKADAPGDAGAARATARDRFRTTGAPEPRAWQTAAVRQHLDALVEDWVKHRQQERIARVREILMADLEVLEKRDEEQASRYDGLREGLGIGDGSGVEASLLVDAVKRSRDLRGKRAALASAQAEVETAAGALERALSAVGEVPAGDADAPLDHGIALGRWSDLCERASRHEALAKVRDGARADFERAEQDTAKRAGELDEFLGARGLAAEQVEPALRLREALRADLSARTDIASLERSIKQTRERHAEKHPELLELDEPELRDKLAAVQGHEAEAKETRDEIAGIEAEVKLLHEDTGLAEKSRAADAARQDLESARERALEGAAMRELLGEMRERHRREGRPRVLESADRLFREFTRDAYQLEDLEGDELRVARADSPARLGPAQLSSGTRTQLLMALRIAFAVEAERGEKLPFFFDEAMLTSDPERYAAIGSAVGEMVASGRQVFYLTAEPREEQELRRALPGVPIKVHDLGTRATELRVMVGDALEPAPLAPVPAPGDETLAEYGPKVGIWEVDGFAEADSLHLLHLYPERLDVAYQILALRRTTVGSVRSWIQTNNGGPWDGKERARFEALRSVAGRALALWREGRSRPLDAEVLRMGPLAKSTKLPDVLQLAEVVQWDARALLKELEDKKVKGLREKLREELRDDLEEQGLLPRSEPLSESTVRQSVRDELYALDADGVLEEDEAEQTVVNFLRWLRAR